MPPQSDRDTDGDVSTVQQLALILMYAFNLHIKERLWIDGYPCEISDDDGQPLHRRA